MPRWAQKRRLVAYADLASGKLGLDSQNCLTNAGLLIPMLNLSVTHQSSPLQTVIGARLQPDCGVVHT